MTENIRLKGLEAPREVLWALRDAIDGRKHLNKWMRDESGLVDSESNIRHEVFSDTLETIYDSLRATRSVKMILPAKSQPTASASSSTSSSPEPLLNRYEALYDDEPESDDGPETPTQDYQNTHAAPLPLPLAKKPKKPVTEEIDLDFDVMIDYRTCGDGEYDYNLNPGIQMAQEWIEKHLLGRVRLAFYLRFLVECQRAYIFPGETTSADPSPTLIVPINPRVRMLKYVMELSQNYHEVSNNSYMQHCCGSALADILETFALELDGIVREPKYDLYFQNPFVAGDIMLHLNDLVRDFGKEICNHRHYVASVLHVYNALRCMEDIQPIPLLDELCAIFEDIIFLGERPRRNFSSIFTRHRGGVPQYGETSGQRGQDLGSNSMWAMKLQRKDVNNDNWEHKETNCHRFEETIDHSVFTKTTLDGSHG